MVNNVNKFIMPNGDEIKIDGGSGLEVCDIGMALYVDETKGLRRYLNGQIIDINTNTQAFLNRLLEIKTTNPDIFTTEENWQAEALLNIDGCVYKFVLNYADDGETVLSVRLPKYPDYVEINSIGTKAPVSVYGNGMTLGLTNGTNNYGLRNKAGGGGSNLGFYPTLKDYGKQVGLTATDIISDNLLFGITTDPTKSGIVGTANLSTSQTKLKLRYFIQIATGQETEANIVNTLENVNGFTLLESKYSDKPLYNESWLLSNGQWNAKAVYPTVYEGLQVEYNTEIEVGTTVTLPSGVSYTKRGLSVKLSTEEYTDYDFVLNTADETFRLPLLNGSEDLPSDRYDDLTLKASGSTYDAPANGWYYLRQVATASGQHATLSTKLASRGVTTASGQYVQVFVPVTRGQTVGISYTAPTNGVFRFIYAQGNGSLYFYVGDIDQNHGIVDMGRIGEQLANKLDKCIHIIDTYVNGTSGYRIWSDGYCEQWGRTGNKTSVVITLTKKMSDTNYNIQITVLNSNSDQNWAATNITVNGFTILDSENKEHSWKACGYLAEGEY